MIRIDDRGKYSLMNIFGNFSIEGMSELNSPLHELVEKKQHLIVNLTLGQNIDSSFFHFLNSVKFLLNDQKRNIILLNPNDETEVMLEQNWKDQFLTAPNLSQGIATIKEKSIFPPNSFLKTLVGGFMAELLFDLSFPSSREKVFIKEKSEDPSIKDNFLGNKTCSILLMNRDVFFHVGIGFSEEALSNLQEKDHFNVLEFVRNNIKKVIDVYQHLELQIVEQGHENLLDPKIRPQSIFFNDEPFKVFEKGITVAIPLDSHLGKIFFEFWIPSQFEKKVLTVINS